MRRIINLASEHLGTLLHRQWHAWAILVISVIMTFSLYLVSSRYYEKRGSEIFNEKTVSALLYIQHEIDEYEYVLKSGAALLEASEYVSRDEWRDFVHTIDHSKISALAYTRYLRPEELTSFAEKLRREGDPDFSIRPAGKRSYYAPVIYIEPETSKNRHVIGFDNASESKRRHALETARDTGKMALSEGLKLIQQNPDDQRQSVIMFVPHYQIHDHSQTLGQPRKRIEGFVSIPFLVADLFESVQSRESGLTLSVEDITPNTAQTKLFTPKNTYDARYHQYKTLEVGGRIWKIGFSSTPEFDQEIWSNEPLFLAIGGLIFDGILFWILIVLFNSRQKLGKQKNEIEKSEFYLRSLLNSSIDGIHILNANGDLIGYSSSFLKMLGYSKEEAKTLRIFDWDVQLSSDAIRSLLADINDEPRIIETLHRRKDGTVFSAEVNIKPFILKGEKVIYCIGRDVTEQKQQLADLHLTHQMIDSANDMAFMIRIEDGYIEYANQTAQSMTGYTLEEMRFIGIEGFRRPIKDQSFIEHLQELKEMGRMSDYAIVIRKDGTEFPVEANVRAIEYEGIDYNIAMVRDITENELYTQKLKKTTQLLKEAQRITQLGSWNLDIRHNRLEWSDEIFHLFEIDPSATIPTYEAFLEVIHPDDRDMVNNAYLTSLKEHGIYSIVHRLLMKDGRIKYVREQCEHFYDENGEPIESHGTVHDITEVVEHSAELKTIYDTSKDGMAITDLQTNFLDFNSAFLQMSGYSSDELTSMSCIDLTPPEELDNAKAILERLFAGEEIKDFEKSLVDKSGKRHTVNLSLAIMPDKQRILANVKDVTLQKQKANELLEIYNQLLLATKAARIGIWSLSFSDMTFTADLQVLEFYGMNPSLAGTPLAFEEWTSRCHPDDVDEAVADLKQAIKELSSIDITYRIIVHGEIKYMHAAAVIKYDNHDHPIGMVGITRDITADKQLENALLDAKVAAENANRTKSDFLANMSHEIRTPLNGIIGLTELVLQSHLEPLQYEYLSKAELAAKTLLGIINNILDYSKMEVNKLTLESIPFDIREIAENLHALFGYKAQEKHLELRTSLAPDLPHHLIGDPLRLMQVLGNLVGNALKFTDKGSVLINIALDSNENGRYRLRFDVSDTGIGMSSEQQTNLFEPFYQADTSHTRQYGGTGLGLMISKEIITLMGGTISVESNMGRGSTFSFSAEFDQVPENMQFTASASPIHNALSPLSDNEEIEILLVEDNDLNQLVASERLKQMGLKVTIANNGLEAVESVKNHHYDAILMDLQMPVMDGFEATRQIRAMEGKEQIPIIALSAAVLQEDRTLALKAGMNEHISKPIDKNQLREILSKWLKL